MMVVGLVLGHGIVFSQCVRTPWSVTASDTVFGMTGKAFSHNEVRQRGLPTLPEIVLRGTGFPGAFSEG